MPTIPKRAECRRLPRCSLEISKEILELRLSVPLEIWVKTNCWRSSKSSPITFAHRFLSDTANCPTGERKKLTRVFLALICSLALACVGVDVAYAGGQKKQQQSRGRPYAGQAPAGYHGAGGGGYQVNVSTNKSALTGKPTTVQALHQNSTIRQVGTPTGAGRQTTVGKLTGTGKHTTAAKQTTVSKPTTVGKLTGAGTPTTLGKPTTIARRPPFNPANTPRTEVTPTVQLQHNSGVQLLNTPISEMSPAVQLQQNSGIQLLNTSTTQVTPAAVQLQHNSAIHLLNPAAQYSINKVTIPGRETVQSLHTSKLNKFSQVAVSGTGGSGQPGGGFGPARGAVPDDR